MSCFSNDENRIKARSLLIQRVKEAMPTASPPESTPSSSSTSSESWEQSVKRRKIEKQAEVI
jgi:hypothetical protein